MAGRGLPFLRKPKLDESKVTNEADDASSVAGSRTSLLDIAGRGRGIGRGRPQQAVAEDPHDISHAGSSTSLLDNVVRGRGIGLARFQTRNPFNIESSDTSTIGGSTSFLDSAIRGRGIAASQFQRRAAPSAVDSDTSTVGAESIDTILPDSSEVGSSVSTNLPGVRGVTTADVHQHAHSSASESMISVGRGRSMFAVRNVNPADKVTPVTSTVTRTTFSDSLSSSINQKRSKDESSSGIVAGRGISGTPFDTSSGSGATRHPTPSSSKVLEQPIVDMASLQKAVQEAAEVPVAKGVKGIKFPAVTNCIKIHCNPEAGVYEYEVRFDQNVDAISLRSQYIRQHAELLGTARTFDGVSLLFLPHLLPNEITKLTSISPVDQSAVNVEIIFKRKKRIGECLQLYNVLFERIYKILRYLRVGRKNFDPLHPQVIKQHKLEIWPGYVKSVEELEGGIMLTLDVSHRVLSTAPAIEIIHDAYSSNPSSYQETAKKALIGKMVITRYNNKTYRIDDIAFDKSPSDTFTQGDKEISYMEYYKKQYNVDIREKKQPLLLSRKEVRISGVEEKREFVFLLVPELCYLCGLTDKMSNNFTVMKDVATYTRVTPMQRVFAYKKFLENVEANKEAKDMLKGWGLSLDTNPLQVTARLLDQQKIVFGNNKECNAGERGDFSKYATSNEVLSAIDIVHWLLVYVKTDRSYGDTFESTLIKISAPTGIRVSQSKRIELINDKTETFVNKIREAVTDKRIQIVVVIFPSLRDDRYAAVKQTLCSDIPIPSQVIQSKTLRNETKVRSIVQKIILQMNAKLGGTLWSIKIPMKDTMICGIDTAHIAGPKAITVGAFVGSLNSEFTRYFSKPTIQGQHEELVNGLTASLEQCLIKYKEFNNRLPERIVLYRDGVGNGQLPVVKSFEIEQFKSAFKRIDPEYKPKLTFIVVQKRINTKIFEGKDINKLNNPKPGTILDHTVTGLYVTDFFLVPQHVNQGSATPSHYIIMIDENQFSMDVIQMMTYRLTFMYYNWPGTVRVPAVCQYAHKLADLVGTSIKRQPHDKLADKLFYL